MALDTLRTNKLRSGLTILGIVIGVMTVISISSVINGLNRQFLDLVAAFGTNVMWVFRFPVIGVRPTTEMLTRKQLTYDDMHGDQQASARGGGLGFAALPELPVQRGVRHRRNTDSTRWKTCRSKATRCPSRRE